MRHPFDVFREFAEDIEHEVKRRSPKEREELRKKRLKANLAEEASVIPVMIEALSDQDVTKHLAKFLHQFYKDLKAAGFSDDEAIRIVSNYDHEFGEV